MTTGIGKIEVSDGVVVDYLLKEKGITRKELEEKLYAERMAASERVKKEADDKREKDLAKAREEKEGHALTTYNEHMVATINGKGLGPLEELRNPPCPRCGAELDFFKDSVFVMANQIHRVDPSFRTTIGGSLIAVFNPLPMLTGTFQCPKKCGQVLELVIETAPPKATTVTGRPSKLTEERKRILLDAIREGQTLNAACVRADIHYDTMRGWLQRAPIDGGIYLAFANDLAAVMAQSGEALETEPSAGLPQD